MRLGPEGQPVVDAPSRSFEMEWPDLARRLHSMLAGKRIPATKREDIVQETGLRLFRMWDAVDPERPVWALAVTIALNLVRDEARRGTSREILGVVPDMAAPHEDVERAGLARIELRRVQRAMLELTPDHRSILMAELGDEYSNSDRGPNAVKMLRMRARRRLTSLLEAASAGSAAFVGRLRKALGLDQHLYSLQSAAGTNQAQLPAMAGMLAVISMLAAAPGSMDLFGKGLEDPTTPIRREAEPVQASSVHGYGGGEDIMLQTRSLSPTVQTRSVRRGPHASAHRPYRVPVPVGEAGFLEGEGEIGVLGFGMQMGEHNGNPACFFGLPVRGLQAGQLTCTSQARGSREGEPVYVRGRARGRVGPVSWQVEV